MTMIDRYVAAVGEQLHSSRRQSVEAELRASILDALEARGGSPHSEDDILEVLAQLGSPTRIAAEYEPDRDVVVGGQWLPHMRRSATYLIAAVLTGGALFYGIGLLLGGLAEFRAGTLLAATLSVMLRAVIGGAIVFVGVFAWLQRSAVRPPPVPAEQLWDPRSFARRPPARRISRFDSAVALVALAVVLLVLDGIGATARAVGSQTAAALQPLASDVVFAVYTLQIAMLLSFVAHVGLLVKGRRLAWASLFRFTADTLAMTVFAAVAFRLVPYRTVLVEAGASTTFVDLLVANVFILAAVAAIIVAATWRSELRGALRWVGSTPSSGKSTILAALLPVVLTVFSGCAAANPQRLAEGGEPALSAFALVSPQVHDDGRVTFRVIAPADSEVGLVLDGRQGVGMTRAEDGVWSYTTSPLASDLYAYHFAIDGQPAFDRNNPDGAPLVTGGRHSYVHVAGAGLPWERQAAPHGSIRRHEYVSDRFGETREVLVYTPPGYDDDGARTYPVLFLLHGVMSDARAWSTIGRADVIMDNLIAADEAEPMIVVMPLGYGIPDPQTRAAELLALSTDQHAVMSEFAAGLFEEVLPLVDREYRTRTDAGSRAIAGFSMGGSQALAIGFAHPDVFGVVASFGGAFIMFGFNYDKWFPRVSEPRATQRIAISVGSDDFLLSINQHMVNWLTERQVEVDFRVVPGSHSMQVGRRELIRLAPTLFR